MRSPDDLAKGFDVFAKVCRRLGWTSGTFEVVKTTTGAVWIKVDQTFYWLYEDTGEPMASRIVDDVLELAWITPEGEWAWGCVPELEVVA